MTLDWNDYRKQLAFGVKEIGQLGPDTIKGYMALSAAGQKTDLLGAKVQELIAIAVAVTLRCEAALRCIPRLRSSMVRPSKRLRKLWRLSRPSTSGDACPLRTRDGSVQGMSKRCRAARTSFSRRPAWVNPDARTYAWSTLHQPCSAACGWRAAP
jgi:hypothetical protein